MKVARWIFTIIAGLSISSCCTEKDCDQDFYPQIVIGYEGINSDNLNGKMIYVLDRKTHNLLDSLEFSNPYNHFVIDKWLMYALFGDKREFKEYDYLLKLGDRQDSLTNINYDRTSEKIDCNNCFPFGDGSATITDFENLEFMINHELYVGVDTVLID